MFRSSSTRAMVCFIAVRRLSSAFRSSGSSGIVAQADPEGNRTLASVPLIESARRLIRRIRSGALATSLPPQFGHSSTLALQLHSSSSVPSTPFASLVTVAAAADLSPLFWLSALARHSRNLAHDPRCSVLLAGPSVAPNPQTAPRVTLCGTAGRIDDPALLARWHALHPYADWYAGLQDFSLWRLRIEAVHAVAGFAAAGWIDPARLAPDPAIAGAFAAAEAAILAHCNARDAASLGAIAAAAGSSGEDWQLIAVDPDGFDLGRAEGVLRIDFPSPLQSPAEFGAALRRLAEPSRLEPTRGQ
ncbi:MAG: HugZ family protein [Acetobacteraceae bacterium]